MAQEDIVAAALSRLTFPPNRTAEPIVIVVTGGRAETARLFDVLSEFFPLVYVARRIANDLASILLADLCGRLAEEGLCAFIEACDVHQSHFSNLIDAGMPAHLIWIADASKDQVTRAGRDRAEWIKSAMGVDDFHLVDPSEDLYPQVFSLPFLPGRRR